MRRSIHNLAKLPEGYHNACSSGYRVCFCARRYVGALLCPAMPRWPADRHGACLCQVCCRWRGRPSMAFRLNRGLGQKSNHSSETILSSSITT